TAKGLNALSFAARSQVRTTKDPEGERGSSEHPQRWPIRNPITKRDRGSLNRPRFVARSQIDVTRGHLGYSFSIRGCIQSLLCERHDAGEIELALAAPARLA